MPNKMSDLSPQTHDEAQASAAGSSQESRRQFLSQCAFVATALAAEGFLVAGCGKATTAAAAPAPISGGNCSANGASVYVAPATTDGHTHTAPAVTSADVNAGAVKAYPLGTTESHTHSITLSVASMTSLKSNQGVALVTDADSTGHSHAIVVNCS